jgi:hypothetical protein
MKIAILEIYPNKKFDSSKGIDAHLRNSIIIGDFLNADVLITENDYLVALKKKIRHFNFVLYGVLCSFSIDQKNG